MSIPKITELLGASIAFDVVETPITFLAANVATAITRAGVANKNWYIHYINWRVSGTAPVGAANLALTLKDGDTIIYQSAIPAAAINGEALHIFLPAPIKITEGNAFTLNIASPANAGCVIYTNIGATNH